MTVGPAIRTAGESLWLSTLTPADRITFPPLDGDTEADVAIVGAGFTGLWTAYYLARRAPGLRVVVVEAEHVGFGATGRNGGWCTTEMPALLWTMVRRHGPMAAMRMFRAGHRTMAEIERVLAAENIDGHLARDGAYYVARSEPQRRRLADWIELRNRLGITDLTMLTERERRDRPRIAGTVAAAFTPNCAAVQPARIAYGLAAAVARAGVGLFEGTRVTAVRPRRLVTDHGTIAARTIVRATEGYTSRLGDGHRQILPVYSHLAATEPLPESVWHRLGFTDRVTVAESRYQFGYLQRTADDRLVIGGRGAGYHLGSRSGRRYDVDARVHGRQLRCLADFFGDRQLSGFAITHSWGGAYGLQRDTEPSVVYDESTGLGYAGGYGGEGIALSNLAARTLTGLITGTESAETRLPWTGHRPRRWEPEPLRWLGVRGISALALRADAYEDRRGRPAPLAGLAMRTVQ
jgi:glycine/D-amino acid oxidase-like deaminating enzyme